MRGRSTSMLTGALVGLAVAFGAAPALAATIKDLLDQSRKLWNAPTEPFRVIGNVYYVGTNGLASYLITGPEGHVLVDTTMPETAGQIRDNIAKLGFKVTDIKWMVNTHAHLDHTGGFAELKRESGAKLAAGLRDKGLLEGGFYPGAEQEAELRFPVVTVDRTVSDGDVVSVGPIRLTAHATPGHSPGCTTWTMPVEEAGREHGVIFFCSATVALNRLFPHPTYPGIVDDYRATFARAPSIAGDVLLAPHPEMYDMAGKRARIGRTDANPFVVPGEFQAYLTKLQSDFETNLTRQVAATKF